MTYQQWRELIKRGMFALKSQAPPEFHNQVKAAFQGGTVAEVTNNLNAQWAALLRGQGVIN